MICVGQKEKETQEFGQTSQWWRAVDYVGSASSSVVAHVSPGQLARVISMFWWGLTKWV